ncbi:MULTISPECIES: ROK family protein [unclassified Brenneria]|uniref:ROK family protein n=1 Tax=unclassified Brenneria TaxID=2634434 RepID=UPI0029C27E76|nr:MULTISPECIES: ROK family protein [unclassified Brenneria]MDX5628709.1 ROK family protein [Brenneria sp. L3-3Z]MDX5695848.1 ROK family protein [Brenneria sp. L4-2C]MEE3661136.1 ROK family protein [Brenneria sp. g21c3]
MLSLGIDIGGSKIEAVVLNPQGEVAYKQRYPTEKQSYTAFFGELCHVIDDVRQALSSPFSIGICLPGTVEASNGKIKNSNILVINQQPLPAMLEAHCRQPVAISNDANCFTLSEAIDGAGQGYDSVFGVILGTGCGGGIAIRQQVLDGRNRCAGEWGHNSLPRYTPERDGPSVACYCGQTNCIESFISGTGLAERYNLRYHRKLTSKAIMDAVEAGDVEACEHFTLFQDQLARSLAGAINLIDPDVIVIGGGLSNRKALYQGLEAQIARYIFSNTFTTPIVQARHGDSSGVRGAAWLGKKLLSTSCGKPLCDSISRHR